MTQEQIMKEVNSWLKPFTPWKHGIALKGYGADCLQFVVALAKSFGWLPKDFKTTKYAADYALHNDISILKQGLADYCTEIKIEDIQAGDVLIYTYGRCANHAGMYLGNGKLVHSHVQNGVVTVDVGTMTDKFDSAWRFNEQCR